MYLVTTASLAVHVRVSAPLRQFLRVRSILSIPISALSAVLALAYVPLRLSVWVNWFINQNKKSLNRAAFYFAYSVYLMSRICWAGA